MAQLPPKIPNMSPNWPSFGHQRVPSMGAFFPASAASAAAGATANVVAQPSWVDEFFDFSAAKRGAHRRSASDSIAFLEAPMIAAVEEACHRNGVGVGVGRSTGLQEFDRLDDDQLMSMFSDDVGAPPAPTSAPPASSNHSTPSDHNSINEEKPGEAEAAGEQQSQEAQSACKAEPPQALAAPPAPAPDPIVDPKRVKRCAPCTMQLHNHTRLCSSELPLHSSALL